jgi:hypothetical protein
MTSRHRTIDGATRRVSLATDKLKRTVRRDELTQASGSEEKNEPGGRTVAQFWFHRLEKQELSLAGGASVAGQDEHLRARALG